MAADTTFGVPTRRKQAVLTCLSLRNFDFDLWSANGSETLLVYSATPGMVGRLVSLGCEALDEDDARHARMSWPGVHAQA
jgi:hypothetical protein